MRNTSRHTSPCHIEAQACAHVCLQSSTVILFSITVLAVVDKMDSSDEDTLVALVLLRKQRKKNKRSFWCREHFLLRNRRGEFQRTFCSLMKFKDEKLFFNYLRMSYKTYEELKSLVLPHLQSRGCNWREPITALFV